MKKEKIDYIFMYGHMNDKEELGMTIPQVARQLMKANYGQQRMLAEMVKLREASEDYQKYRQYAEHTQRLRELLEKGWY